LKLRKSASGLKRPVNLIRGSILIEVVDEKDIKLAYLAYRLDQLPKGWNPVEGLKPREFTQVFEDFVFDNYTNAWSVRENNEPIIIIFGVLVSGFILAGDVIWNPKAGAKNKVMAVAKFFDEVKDVLIFSEFNDKPFYERFMDYGILRRVGTVYKDNERMAQFQTRS